MSSKYEIHCLHTMSSGLLIPMVASRGMSGHVSEQVADRQSAGGPNSAVTSNPTGHQGKFTMLKTCCIPQDLHLNVGTRQPTKVQTMPTAIKKLLLNQLPPTLATGRNTVGSQ